MCGRFTLRISAPELAEVLGLVEVLEFTPRFNVAPTQSVVTVLGDGGERRAAMMRWGLIPSWANDERIGSRMINARAETVAEKPSFRAAFKRRRCLIPADGFYEWKPLGGKKKQPHFIGLKNEQPFAFAGLWESWTSPDTGEITSCTIITTEANSLLADMHERMPVILNEATYDVWLGTEESEVDSLHPLLTTYPASEMRTYAVSSLVNRPQNDEPACIEPVASQQELFE